MERFENKKVLIVGIGRTGFNLIHFFNNLKCEIRVTDIKPIFDLNKAVKKVKKINPVPAMTFGEHRDEDFLEADVIVYSSSVNPELPQLELARKGGREVYSEFSLANKLCRKEAVKTFWRAKKKFSGLGTPVLLAGLMLANLLFSTNSSSRKSPPCPGGLRQRETRSREFAICPADRSSFWIRLASTRARQSWTRPWLKLPCGLTATST